MILLVRQELLKLSRRFTPYVVYLAIMSLIAVVVFSLRHHPPGFLRPDRITHKINDVDVMGSPLNGFLVCEMVLKTLAKLLPFMAPVVAGELLGGEGATGTLRTLLVRPRSRSAIWWAKALTAWLYTLSLAAVTMLTSLGLGCLVFGGGKLWVLSALHEQRVVVLTPQEALWYLALAYLMMALAVYVAAMLGFMLGSFFDNALAPGFAAMSIVFTLYVVSALDFDWIDHARPYFLTTLATTAGDLIPTRFDPETMALLAPWQGIREILRISAVYLTVFGVIGWWRFCRRDVTC